MLFRSSNYTTLLLLRRIKSDEKFHISQHCTWIVKFCLLNFNTAINIFKWSQKCKYYTALSKDDKFYRSMAQARTHMETILSRGKVISFEQKINCSMNWHSSNNNYELQLHLHTARLGMKTLHRRLHTANRLVSCVRIFLPYGKCVRDRGNGREREAKERCVTKLCSKKLNTLKIN